MNAFNFKDIQEERFPDEPSATSVFCYSNEKLSFKSNDVNIKRLTNNIKP